MSALPPCSDINLLGYRRTGQACNRGEGSTTTVPPLPGNRYPGGIGNPTLPPRSGRKQFLEETLDLAAKDLGLAAHLMGGVEHLILG